MSDPTTTNIVITAKDQTGPALKSAAGNLKTLGTTGASASQQLSQSGEAYLESLQRQIDMLGKTRAQIAEFRAQQLGVAEAAAPMIAQLKASEQTVEKLGVSIGQTKAAIRQLPSQFTDIVTQLAGGQNPFLILLEQGGQIKDSFGGFGPTFKQFASYVTVGRVAALGLAGAVAAVTIAIIEGSREQGAYNKALIETGGYAGKTAGQIADMAAAVGDSRGNTGLAADALAKLTASGRIAGDQLQITAQAAVDWARATGGSVDDTVKDFVRLADEPAKASAKLNEQYHYLTATVYEQIDALERNGQKNEAAAVAETAFANAMKERASSVSKSLGVLQRAWNALATDAREAWDQMLGLGREQSTNEKLASLQKTLDDKLARGPVNEGVRGAYDKGVQNLRDQISLLQSSTIEERKFATQRGESLKIQENSIQAQDRIRKLIDDSATKQEKMNKALADSKRDFDAIRKADPNSELLKKEAQTYADIRDKYKEKGPAPKAYQDDAATKMLEQLRQQNAAVQDQLASTEKLTSAESERAKFNQQIADIKTKGQLTADQKSLLATQDAIRAQLDINVASEQALETKKKAAELDKKHLEDLRQAQQLIEATNLRIDASLKGQREQYDRQLSVIGLGSQAAEQVQSTKAIYKQYQDIQTSFTENMGKKGLLGSDDYTKEVERIRASLGQALDLNAAYYDQLKKEQGDWANGARAATQNYLDDVQNVAKSTQEAFSSAFKGIEDGLTEFLTTGKANAGDIGKQLATEIVRPLVRQNLTGPLAKYVQGLLPAKATDDLGDFLKARGLIDGAGTTAASTSTSALASSAAVATDAVSSLGAAALAAANAMGGGSIASLGSALGGNTGALTAYANALPGDSLDNLFALTKNFASFDVGTDYVQKDMFARIHKGEKIVRAADNVKGGGSGASRGGDTYNFSVGDVATVSLLKKALANSQRQMAAGLARSQKYGGALD